MNLTDAQAGMDYVTVPLALNYLSIEINGDTYSFIPDEVNGAYIYTIPAQYVQPPGPIEFMNGSTLYATANIRS